MAKHDSETNFKKRKIVLRRSIGWRRGKFGSGKYRSEKCESR